MMLNQFQAENNATVEQLRLKEEEIEQLREKIEHLEINLNEKDTKIQLLIDQIVELEEREQNQADSDLLAEESRKNKELASRIEMLQAENNELEVENEDLKNIQQDLQTKLGSLTVLDQENKRLEGEITRLSVKVEENTGLQVLLQEVTEQREQLHNKDLEIRRFKDELKKNEEKEAELYSAVKKQKEAFTAIKGEMAKELAIQEEETKKRDERIDELLLQMEGMKLNTVSRKRSTGVNLEMLSQLQAPSEEIIELENQIKDLIDENEELKESAFRKDEVKRILEDKVTEIDNLTANYQERAKKNKEQLKLVSGMLMEMSLQYFQMREKATKQVGNQGFSKSFFDL